MIDINKIRPVKFFDYNQEWENHPYYKYLTDELMDSMFDFLAQHLKSIPSDVLMYSSTYSTPHVLIMQKEKKGKIYCKTFTFNIIKDQVHINTYDFISYPYFDAESIESFDKTTFFKIQKSFYISSSLMKSTFKITTSNYWSKNKNINRDAKYLNIKECKRFIEYLCTTCSEEQYTSLPLLFKMLTIEEM